MATLKLTPRQYQAQLKKLSDASKVLSEAGHKIRVAYSHPNGGISASGTHSLLASLRRSIASEENEASEAEAEDLETVTFLPLMGLRPDKMDKAPLRSLVSQLVQQLSQCPTPGKYL